MKVKFTEALRQTNDSAPFKIDCSTFAPLFPLFPKKQATDRRFKTFVLKRFVRYEFLLSLDCLETVDYFLVSTHSHRSVIHNVLLSVCYITVFLSLCGKTNLFDS